MAYILVGIGGAFGSAARYKLGKIISERSRHRFPIGTFIINITGAFLLGVVSASGVSANWYHLLADGFLGAYTTFSTFMYEGFNLFKENRIKSGIFYISISLVLGIIGFVLGSSLALAI